MSRKDTTWRSVSFRSEVVQYGQLDSTVDEVANQFAQNETFLQPRPNRPRQHTRTGRDTRQFFTESNVVELLERHIAANNAG